MSKKFLACVCMLLPISVFGESQYLCTASTTVVIEANGDVEEYEDMPPLYVNKTGVKIVSEGDSTSIFTECEFFGKNSAECVLSSGTGDFFAMMNGKFVYLDSSEAEDETVRTALIRGKCFKMD